MRLEEPPSGVRAQRRGAIPGGANLDTAPQAVADVPDGGVGDFSAGTLAPCAEVMFGRSTPADRSRHAELFMRLWSAASCSGFRAFTAPAYVPSASRCRMRPAIRSQQPPSNRDGLALARGGRF
eukprot:361251-Chlamydomonas_euryale.AAC.6